MGLWFKLGLLQLEYLSLLSQVCYEFETHLGFGDKVLAEFIIEMGRNCETVDEFDTKLKENGADMPDYLIRRLLTTIHGKLPPKRKSESDMEAEFSALSIKDNGGSRIGLSECDSVPSRTRRMSSAEKWEANQLIAPGVMSVKDFPMFYEAAAEDEDEDGDGDEMEMEMGCFIRRRK